MKSSIKSTAPSKNSSSGPNTTHKAFLAGGGEMGKMMRAYDWSKTPMDDTSTWPDSLRTAISIMLNSSFPMFIWWDKDKLINFYNDAYKVILGDKHPEALGASAKETWAEIWKDIEPLSTQVFQEGKSVYLENLKLIVNRYGHDEETYFTFSYSPLRSEAGEIAGLFCAVTETTKDVLTTQRLQESEERFRNLADTAPMYIAMADETGQAVYFNKPWLKYTGKKLEEMKGLGWLSTLHPEDAPKFEKDFKRAFKKQIPIHKEYRFKKADGQYRWMLAIGSPRFTPDGHFSGYFGTYTDFHELKEAQLAIAEREERFRTLVEKSADAVQLVSREGKILYSSEAVKNVLGYTPEELAHAGVTPYLHPEDKEYFFKEFNDLIKHPNKQVTLHYRVKHKNGSWAWLETVGVNHLNTPNINALVGNFRNITEQKQAEEKLRKSEERFRALANNIPNFIWMAKADGYIYWYNERWYEYTGTTPEKMEGWGWQSVHHPDYLAHVNKEWAKSIKSGKEFEMVFPLKGADGTFRPFLTRVVPIRSSDGSIEQWVGSNTDVSEQDKIKLAEARTEELEAINSQLALQRKELIELNQAKDEFISLASHQLRTPATGVKQYIGMLLEGYAGELTPKQKNFAVLANESNERQIIIINDLLEVAQIDAGKMHIRKKKINLVAFMQNILDEHATTFAERSQKIIFKYADPTLSTHADEDRIRMVLDNLIDNASKYTPPNKKISVGLSKAKDKEKLRIKIKDEGVGIAAKDCTKIFDKFVRIDNSLSSEVGGSGLGLYLAKRIIDLHDGTITVSSKPGEGSTFTVTLPA